jgi:SAM-dependent methyltransferase
MTHDYFGSEIAPRYDDEHSAMFEPGVVDPAVDRLEELAAGRPALEFAIGTGRVALPLAARGVRVAGIELSAAMVDQLRAKSGGTDIPVTLGDIATARVEGKFGLVYLVFNTIVNLLTQDAQVDAFVNAAAHLESSGCFVVEVNVPQLRRLPPGENAHVIGVDENYWGISVYDVVEQRLVSHHLTADTRGIRRRSIPFRYVWPAELDLMARLAGMRLRARWGDWRGAPFTAESRSHVSVWEKPQLLA